VWGWAAGMQSDIQGVCCSPWGCGVVVSVVNRFTTRSDRRFTTIRETICKNEYRSHRPTTFRFNIRLIG